MRVKKLFIVLALCVGLGAYAAGAQPQIQKQNDDAERVKLATRMHQIKPVKPLINAAIESLAFQVPEDKREAFINAMMLATNYDAIEKASIDDMARIFSQTELKTMVDYYGSEAAKSAEAKMPDYLKGVSANVQKALDESVLNAALNPASGAQNNPQKTTP